MARPLRCVLAAPHMRFPLQGGLQQLLTAVFPLGGESGFRRRRSRKVLGGVSLLAWVCRGPCGEWPYPGHRFAGLGRGPLAHGETGHGTQWDQGVSESWLVICQGQQAPCQLAACPAVRVGPLDE